MTTYYSLTIKLNGSEKKSFSLYYGTLEKILCVWSEYFAKDETVEYAFITRYSDKDTPGIPIMDLNLNSETDKEYEKPFIQLK